MNSAWIALSKSTKFITKNSYITLILFCLIISPVVQAKVNCEAEFSYSFLQTQSPENMLYFIEKDSQAEAGKEAKEMFFKQNPQYALYLHSGNFEDYEPIVQEVVFKYVIEGMESKEKFLESLAANVGSFVILSSKKDSNTPDFYIMDKADKVKYQGIGIDTMLERRPLETPRVMADWIIDGLTNTDEVFLNVMGVENVTPKTFYRASALGYPISSEITFQTPWGEVTKNAGDDIWLIVNEVGEPYVVTAENHEVGSDNFQRPEGHISIDDNDKEVQSRGDMLNRIAQRLTIAEEYNKVPYLGYKITSTNIDDYPKLIQEAIINKLGAVDNTKYTSYLAENVGSAFSIQYKKDGTPDFYIIGKDDYNSDGYQKISPLEVERDNRKLVDTFKSNPEFAALFDAQDENIVGILKTEKIKLFRMSDLGYSIDDLVRIMPEWNWPQDKPAGQDAWLVINENANPYMVNADVAEGETYDPETTLPINYVPAN